MYKSARENRGKHIRQGLALEPKRKGGMENGGGGGQSSDESFLKVVVSP